MKIERTMAGLQVELRATGMARFSGITFLSLWLTIWVAGEAGVLWILGAGGWGLVTGTPMTAGSEPLDLGPSLAAGIFLLVWLSLWTLGGYAAGVQLLRLLWGGDTFTARNDGLEVVYRYAPFRSRVFIPRIDLRSIYCLKETSSLVAGTANSTIDLTCLGSPENRAEIAEALNQEFQLGETSPQPALPNGWREIKSPEDATVLVREPETRRKQARVTLLFALPIAATAVILIAQATQKPGLGFLAGLVAVFALALLFGAAHLGLTRQEWKIEPGKVTLQRRARSKLTPKFTGFTLELRETSNDGPWFQLVALAANPTALSHRNSQSNMRTIHSCSNDPYEPRMLGEWLAERAQIPFTDQTTPEAKEQELEKLHEQLANSGRFGRAMSGVLKRATPSRPRT